MLQRIAFGLGRRLGDFRSLAVAGAADAQALAFSSSSAPAAQKGSDIADLDLKDVDGSLARHLWASSEGKEKKDLMTKDVMKIIGWLEDSTPSDDKGYEGKLKDLLPSFDKQTQNQICTEMVETDEMASIQPALKDLVVELGTFGEAGRIVDVVYKYVSLLDPKKAEATSLAVELVVAKSESAAEIEEKKNMLIQDMINKGKLDAKTPVSWTVTVDPRILGGCIYKLGDVELDCSRKTMEDEFYASLEKEGIKRIA